MDSIVQTRIDADRIVTLLLNQPGKHQNTITTALLSELAEAVNALEREPAPAGVIFASGKADSFLVGADLFELRDMNDRERERFLAGGQELLERIARLRVPTVAAINGHCLGGGLELALACRYRVATDDHGVRIGLPEIQLGILPAWGGTVRLPRLIGIPAALGLILTSENLPPRKALRMGVVDEVVRPERLLAAAKRKLLSGDRPHRPSAIHRSVPRIRFARERIFAIARRQTLEKTFGHYPAAEKLIDVMRTGYEDGPAAGLQAERDVTMSLMGTPACRNLMRLFFLRQECKQWMAGRVPDRPADVTSAAVIGGGTMGSGIAYTLIRAGIGVRLVEVGEEAMSAAMGRIRKLLDAEVADRRLESAEARHVLNRVTPCVDWTGLGEVDLVVEAVAERLEVKKQVFARLSQLVRPEAILATNTSSLRVDELAASASHAGRVVGLHFFNPVPMVPLVEVVAGPRSGGRALATAMKLVDRIGKVGVLVQDAPGFVVNRILVPYLTEPLIMATEGIDIRLIDQSMIRWGMPIGPFALVDGVGLDIASEVLNSLRDQDPFIGHLIGAWRPGSIQRVIERGWLGQKTGRGFYVYNGWWLLRRDPPLYAPTLIEFTGISPQTNFDSKNGQHSNGAKEIQERVVLPMINEGVRLLHEGIIDRPDALDLASIFGLGFAPFQGGLVGCADALGTAYIVQRLNELAKAHGPRFSPHPLLRQLADRNERLSGYTGAAPELKANPQPHFARAEASAEPA